MKKIFCDIPSATTTPQLLPAGPEPGCDIPSATTTTICYSDLAKFNRKLAQWLIDHNTFLPHHSAFVYNLL